jgi:long-chain acyl-CoA synthetase
MHGLEGLRPGQAKSLTGQGGEWRMEATGATAGGKPVTFPQYLLLNAKRFAVRPAMRMKDYGIWQTWTWSEQRDEIRDFALGLKEMGLKEGDRIAIVGSNRPRLYWAFCAAQSLKAIPVPVYADSVAEEMAYVLNHAGVRFAVVQDQEQVDKIQSMAEEIPGLTDIIYDEPRGLRDYDHTQLHEFRSHVQEKGRAAGAIGRLGGRRLGGRDPGFRWQRSFRDPLHIRHHRTFERRDADRCQPR